MAFLKTRRVVLFALLWTVVALAATRFALTGHAIYNHDWSWPFTWEQLRSSIILNIGAWNPDGLGSPNLRPIATPLYFLWFVGVIFRNASVTLVLSLALAFSSYALGMYYACRTIAGAEPIPSFLMATASALGVPIFNELAAGHLNYLIAIATLPWILALLFDKRTQLRRNVLVASVLVALSAIQIQIFILEIALLVVAVIVRGNVGWRLAAASGLTAVSLALPLLAVAFSPGVHRFTGTFETGAQWILSNSSPLPEGLILLGYAPAYAEAAINAVRPIPVELLLWLPFTLAVLTLILLRVNIVLEILFVLCTLLVIGSHGPLGSLLSAGFNSSIYLNVFRELYDFAGPAWTAQMILASALFRKLPRSGALLVALTTFVACAALWVPPNLANRVALQKPSEQSRVSLSSLFITKGDWKFFVSPGETPVGPAGQERAGADPTSYPVGSHPAAQQYQTEGTLEVASAFLRFGNLERAKVWFARAGVGRVFAQNEIVGYPSHRVPPPAKVPSWLAGRFLPVRAHSLNQDVTCVLCSYAQLRRPGDLMRENSAGDFVASSTRACASIPAAGFDPSIGWAPISYWTWVDPQIALLSMADPSARLTWSNVPFEVHSCNASRAVFDVLVLNGSAKVGNQTIESHSKVLRQIVSDAPVLVRPRSGLVAVGASTTQAPQGITVPLSSLMEYSWSDERGGGEIPPGTQWIVLKESFSPGWQLSLTGGRVLMHTIANGYANAWRIDAPKGGNVTVWYGPRTLVIALQLLGAGVWVCAVFILVSRQPLAGYFSTREKKEA